jgi:flavin reductase (DIM6/NTAB) family NADH-FMN oxidoreductase RutF
VTSEGANSSAFEAIMAGTPTPSYVVTTAADGGRAGCLVGFAGKCSIEPPRFAVWLSKVNHTYRVAQGAQTLVVHLLREGDDDLAELFGGETGDEVDKFSGVDWQPGPDGCPIITRLDWFAGAIADRFDTGDHVAFVIEPFGGRCARASAEPLSDEEVGQIDAGHPVRER